VHVSNEEKLRQYLLKAYPKFKECGAGQYSGIEAKVMKYSYRAMARKLLEEITK